MLVFNLRVQSAPLPDYLTERSYIYNAIFQYSSPLSTTNMIESVYETKIFIALCERTFKTVIQVLL